MAAGLQVSSRDRGVCLGAALHEVWVRLVVQVDEWLAGLQVSSGVCLGATLHEVWVRLVVQVDEWLAGLQVSSGVCLAHKPLPSE